MEPLPDWQILGTILTRYFSSSRLLMLFSIGAALFSVIAITGHGQIVIYSMSIVGFFMSIMFPTIFALGLVGLKRRNKSRLGPLLVMAIVGGAIHHL